MRCLVVLEVVIFWLNFLEKKIKLKILIGICFIIKIFFKMYIFYEFFC